MDGDARAEPCTRKLAWFSSATCMVGLRNLHGSARRSAWFRFQRCMVGLKKALPGIATLNTQPIYVHRLRQGCDTRTSHPAIAELRKVRHDNFAPCDSLMSHLATSRYRTLPLSSVAQCDSNSLFLTPKISAFSPRLAGDRPKGANRACPKPPPRRCSCARRR